MGSAKSMPRSSAPSAAPVGMISIDMAVLLWSRFAYLWQTLSSAMQELPHGLLFAGLQFGCVASGLLLRQGDMKFCRAVPVMPEACVLQSFIRCCCELSAA